MKSYLKSLYHQGAVECHWVNVTGHASLLPPLEFRHKAPTTDTAKEIKERGAVEDSRQDSCLSWRPYCNPNANGSTIDDSSIKHEQQ